MILAPEDMLHPEFKLDSITELPLGKIPDLPKSATPLRSAGDYFKAVPKVKNELSESPEKVIDGNLLKSPTKATKIPPISNSSQTPKISLLDRVSFLKFNIIPKGFFIVK